MAGSSRTGGASAEAPPAAPVGGDDDEWTESYRPLAIYAGQRHAIGVALYDEVRNELQVSELAVSDAGRRAAVLREIIEYTAPSELLLPVSIASDAELLGLLRAPEEGSSERLPFQIIKSTAWKFRAALATVCASVAVSALVDGAPSPDGPPGAGDVPRPVTREELCSLVNIESRALVAALGGLVSGLVLSSRPPKAGNVLLVNDVTALQACRHMRVDFNTQQALQVFSDSFHPNLLASGGSRKDGYSLFALLDRTVTLPGRRALRDWMKAPLIDGGRIQERLAAIEFLHTAGGRELLSTLRRMLKRLHDIPRILQRLRKATADARHWFGLQQSIATFVEAHATLLAARRSTRDATPRPEASPPPAAAAAAATAAAALPAFLEAAAEDIQPEALTACLDLLSVVDWAQSRAIKSLVIAEGVSEQLDAMRETYDVLDRILNANAHEILAETPLLDEIRVEYLPQVGYLVVVPADKADLVPPNFRFVYEEDGHGFFKEPHCERLDAEVGDIQSDILDAQACIIRELESRILAREAVLRAAADAVARVDCLLALAVAASDFGFKKPAITEDDVIIIKRGRHPLQELTVGDFVANDCFVDAQRRAAVVTGPNSSGKSVYIKQVGIIVFLAHIGSYVPADAALIGLTDAIYTRIASRESAAVLLSTMTIDLNQAAGMLRGASRRSLLLLDEFGKGTARADGIALLLAVLRAAQRTGARVFATAHFFDAEASRALLQAEPGMQAFQMQVVVEDDGGEADAGGADSVVPLFKLKPGCARSSYGMACARRGGVAPSVVARARHIDGKLASGELIEPAHDTSLPAPALRLASLFLSGEADASALRRELARL